MSSLFNKAAMAAREFEWTVDDEDKALSEGWRLGRNSSETFTVLAIMLGKERRFASDDDALRHVERMAFESEDAIYAKALRLVRG